VIALDGVQDGTLKKLIWLGQSFFRDDSEIFSGQSFLYF
jgi:hypothetical protein